MARVDWASLATRVGLDGNSGSSIKAREAIVALLGEDTMRQAVDYYIAGGPGSELARHVLWQLHPWTAMTYCREIALSGASLGDRESAAELLRVVADERVLEWIPEFLNSDAGGVQFWGFLILDQLLQSGFIEPEDAQPLIHMGETHGNDRVREQARELRRRLNGA